MEGNTGGAASAPEKSAAEKCAEEMRSALLVVERAVAAAKKEHTAAPVAEKEDRGEVLANLTLAYRCVEDARMRLGKVFQALNGGVSNNAR